MKRAEILGLPPQEQHGGISVNTPIDVLLLVSIFLECARQTRSNSALGSYEAVNFYYCVSQNFALLTDQDFYIPLLDIIFCLKLIQEMEFYLRKIFGGSKG